MHLVNGTKKELIPEVKITLTGEEIAELQPMKVEMIKLQTMIIQLQIEVVDQNNKLQQLIGSQNTYQVILDRAIKRIAGKYDIKGPIVMGEDWTISKPPE